MTEALADTVTRTLPETLMIASPLDALRGVAATLGAAFVAVPECPLAAGDHAGPGSVWSHTDALDEWRTETSQGPQTGAIVVAVWPTTNTAAPFTTMSPTDFAVRSEWPFVAWYAALGAAIERCADGGTIVAVIERPSPLDCAGWAPESGTADAVEAMIRSLARSEGPRGVRVNAVTTPSRLAPAQPIAPPPPLSSFPGSVDHEVSNAVSMLLGSGSAGVTGTVVHADCGRSWR